jgi:photosynthetic reaction center cytochrome c subunit
VKQSGVWSARATLTAVSVLSLSGLFTLVGAQESSPPPKKKPVTARQQYKNIKVLKNLPADQLIPVMRNINASLGVRCDFCHVINPDHTGFEKDDKPAKETARRMVVLVQHLNRREKAVDNKATCFMCHHGRPEPETIAPAPPPPPGSANPSAGAR